jgi:hypothetical protein
MGWPATALGPVGRHGLGGAADADRCQAAGVAASAARCPPAAKAPRYTGHVDNGTPTSCPCRHRHRARTGELGPMCVCRHCRCSGRQTPKEGAPLDQLSSGVWRPYRSVTAVPDAELSTSNAAASGGGGGGGGGGGEDCSGSVAAAVGTAAVYASAASAGCSG